MTHLTNLVEFPALGLSFPLNRVAFSIGGINIYWYGVCIAVGMCLALVFAFRHGVEFGVDAEDTGETAEPQPDAELSGMVDAIYQLQPVEAMGIETVAVDLTDESWYGYLAGLTADNVGKVDAAVVSEPMTGSQAYSLVLLRLKDKADAREIADSMEENISMRKWVCVEADKARVVSFEDKLLYVMADSELVDVDLLADAAAKAFDATFDVDDSLVNEDESELPPELLTAPAVAD